MEASPLLPSLQPSSPQMPCFPMQAEPPMITWPLIDSEEIGKEERWVLESRGPGVELT